MWQNKLPEPLIFGNIYKYFLKSTKNIFLSRTSNNIGIQQVALIFADLRYSTILYPRVSAVVVVGTAASAEVATTAQGAAAVTAQPQWLWLRLQQWRQSRPRI